ncbi:LiaF domain-containing protein [Pedobacter sp. KR3-3]|uniref:LiaF domain-containing protein n=1 Tax=Pedobacter albus TaxID=3113905 RepID=A0ABU7I380_9SPHI|nr:LiaF domain-containing protein [Pedobacter sp. KR3-3]MEE1943867.1 LiaF domain-containing protein [Pedobacter sp. KR3-3]
MENNNNNTNVTNRSGKVWAGLIIIVVGALILLDNVGLDLPRWLFSWGNILIVIGLLVGFKHNFRHSGWFIMILIGSYFSLENSFGDTINFSKIVFPCLIVALGLFILFKPKSTYQDHAERWKRKNDRWNRRGDRWNRRFGNEPHQFSGEEPIVASEEEKKNSSNDYLESVNVFGGCHQAVFSKNFKGGEIVAVFGGCDLNLTQADFEGEVTIDVTAIFGGTKIVVPPGWRVKSEVTAVFGGLDDKRSIQPLAEGVDKTLIIRGIALFGGVDIRNY